MKRTILILILFFCCSFSVETKQTKAIQEPPTKYELSQQKRKKVLLNIKQNHVSIYINSIWEDAQFIENVYNIPLELVIAQSCLETNYGRSNLCLNHCNYFGIQGFKFYSKSECFIKYADILTCLPCYANLQPKTLDEWLIALDSCGYAEKHAYIKDLKRIIKTYLTIEK